MLALPLTIFIYQLIATLGVVAITAVVIAVTALDFRLMYMQGPLDKIFHCKRFKSSRIAKGMVMLLTLISVVVMFLPTLLVYGTDIMGYSDHYLTDIKQHSQEDYALNPFSNPNPIVLPSIVQEYPPFDDFRVLYMDDASDPPGYIYRNWVNAESIVKTYLYKHLNVPVAKNAGGVWYGVMANLTNRPWTHEYGDTYRLYNLYQRQYEAPVPQRVDASTGRYYTDANVPTYTFGAADQDSFSLHACNGQLLYNLSSFDNHQILTVVNASTGVQCYPQFDTSIPVTVQVGSIVKSSVLDDHYGVYRSARLDKVQKSSSAISVSAIKLNDTYITMAIKKQTHLTYHGKIFNSHDNDQELLDCSSAHLDESNREQDNTEYNAYNHTSILCQLKQLSFDNPGFNALQAARRAYGDKSIVNSVYTYMAPTVDNPLGGFGVDLTYFTALTLKSAVFNLPEGEHLIAHGFNDERAYASASSVEALIHNIDIFGTDDITDPTLPNLVKIQASLKAKNFYYFSKWTASVHLAYNMNDGLSWKFLFVGLGSIFAFAACFGYFQRKKSLRALISACPTDERIDDTATLVDGRRGVSKVKANLQKPTKFAFAESSSISKLPVLTVDGKTILLENAWL
ncbi:hypothetical protein MAM1_0015c01463 [Mucor ambiguus]|uniref:Uncharacterized protein n=1 Tax=Mucor ambiguus TaxID=91626 RepID=A0A0C9M5Y7_9FUNG|nr:hypothetical protein MAM1_0015c01463 [Mucor ambiguus]